METIKLRTKQLEKLTKIQEEKGELTKSFEALNKSEILILELLFEENGVDSTKVTNIKLETDGSLTFDLPIVNKDEEVEPELVITESEKPKYKRKS